MSWEKAAAFTLAAEGGYVSPEQAKKIHDTGGETNFGISDMRDGVADGMTDVDGDHKPDTKIKDLTREQALIIYKRDYWDASGAAKLPEPLDAAHFDAWVNHSPGTAQGLLHAAAGTANGHLLAREAFYRKLVNMHPEKGVNLKGWLKRLDNFRKAFGVER